MGTLTISIDLPRDLLGALDIPEDKLPSRITELVALELVREGRISSGKAAELLGIPKAGFVRLMAQNGVPYFTESSAELSMQVEIIQRALDGHSV